MNACVPRLWTSPSNFARDAVEHRFTIAQSKDQIAWMVSDIRDGQRHPFHDQAYLCGRWHVCVDSCDQLIELAATALSARRARPDAQRHGFGWLPPSLARGHGTVERQQSMGLPAVC